MNSKLTVMHIVETQAPDLMTEAINDALFDRLKMKPIAVLIQDSIGGDHAGFCIKNEFTNQHEVVLEASLFDSTTVKNRKSRLKNIIAIYLHECAHRLTMNFHDARFISMSLILHMRAGNDMIDCVSLYDLNEEKLDRAEALKFAYQLAASLADSELTAEECATVVSEKYKSWCAWMHSAEDRDAESEARKQMQLAQRKKADAEKELRIRSLKQDRWQWAFYASIFTVLTINFIH